MSQVLGREAYAFRTSDPDFAAAVNAPSGDFAAWVEGFRQTGGFAFCKVTPDQVEAIQGLENLGFRLIDTNVSFSKTTLANETTAMAEGYAVAFAQPQDHEATREVGATAFEYTRFHLDPQISNETADQLKGQWAANFFVGKRGDRMILAKCGDKVAGFLQVLVRNETLIIDLIATAKNHRKKGLARAMMSFAESQIPGINEVIVGTQMANIPSIRLYQRMGFQFKEGKYVFHWHTTSNT